MRGEDGEEEYLPDPIGLYEFEFPSRLREAAHGQFQGVVEANPRLLSRNTSVEEDTAGFGGRANPVPVANGIHAGMLELANASLSLLELRRKMRFEAQGAIHVTGIATHLAICGKGFFMVRDPVTGQKFALRRGDFHWDTAGYLVSQEGFRVQGLADAGLTQLGDIRQDTTGAPPSTPPNAKVRAVAIAEDGKILIRLTDGTEFVRGCILLQLFREPFLLQELPSRLLSNVRAAQPRDAMAAPGSVGVGRIEAGALEIEVPPKEFAPLAPRGCPRLEILSEMGARIRIQATTNFRDWQTVDEIVNENGIMDWADLRARTAQSRFYRLIWMQ